MVEFSYPTVKADFHYGLKEVSVRFPVAPVINSLCHQILWIVCCVVIYADLCHSGKCIVSVWYCTSSTLLGTLFLSNTSKYAPGQ